MGRRRIAAAGTVAILASERGVSAEALLWAVEQRVGDPLARFLLLILAGAADEWGVIDAGAQERAGEWTEMNSLELLHAYRRLREGGWIESAGALRLRMWKE